MNGLLMTREVIMNGPLMTREVTRCSCVQDQFNKRTESLTLIINYIFILSNETIHSERQAN